jgi:predicted molibdopterin-dependent oxidoreductase YjgC
LASPEIDAAGLSAQLEPNTVEKAAEICGIEAGRIKELARALCEAKNVSLIAGEFLTSSSSRETLSSAISNMALLAGIPEKGQIGFLARYSNSKGAEKLGVMPFLSERMIGKLRELWGAYPESAGLAADRMILAAKKEDIDSLFVIGSNPIIAYPDGQFVRAGFDKLDFLVVADLFETETTAVADVVLPLSSWTEHDGTFVNLEGTVQRFGAAIKPVGHSLPGYEVMSRISSQLKVQLYESLEKLEEEASGLLGSDDEAKLEAKLREVRYVKEDVNPDYPVPLYAVDELHHFGHLTEKSKSLSAFCTEAFLEMSPSMAEKYKADNGTLIRVESEVGKVVLPVRISEIIDNDVVLVTRNFSTTPVNGLQMRKRRIDRVKLTRVEEE